MYSANIENTVLKKISGLIWICLNLNEIIKFEICFSRVTTFRVHIAHDILY